MNINIGAKIDLQKLISSRLFVQAGSGGGKTTLLKKLAEKTNGKVQQIIFDYEGEFSSLREKFPYALIAKSGGEIAIQFNPNYIETLVHKILETRISVIIDLFECKMEQRQDFTERFLNALMDAPKKYWHPIEIIIDEIQIGAPENENPASKRAIADLATRGRKRGYFLVAASLRVQDVSKSVLAQCHNRIIGYNGLDIDVERAAKEIGLTRPDYHLLKELERNEFYAFGPAISKKVIQFTTGALETSYTKAGEGVKVAPPTPDAIKKILSKLDGIPKEAENELKTKTDLENKIRTLTSELNQAKKGNISNDKIAEIQKQANENAMIHTAKLYDKFLTDLKAKFKDALIKRDNEINRLKIHIERSKDFIAGFNFADIPIVEFPNIQVNSELLNKPVNILSQSVQTDKKPVYTMAQAQKPALKPIYSVQNSGLKPGEKLVLNVIAQYDGAEDDSIAVLTGYKKTSRYEYIRSLKAKGYCTESAGKYYATSEGIEILGNDYEPLPQGYELQQYWMNRLQGGELSLFKILVDAYPESKTKQDLIDESIYKGTSVYEYCRKLQSRKIIINENGNYKVSENLF